MSHTSISFHYVTELKARVSHVNTTHWLTLTCVDRDGAELEVTLYSETPEALIASLAADAIEAAKQEAYAEGRKDEAEAREMGEAV